MSHNFLRCVFLKQGTEANAVKNVAKVCFPDVLWFFHLPINLALDAKQTIWCNNLSFTRESH